MIPVILSDISVADIIKDVRETSTQAICKLLEL